MSHSVDYLMVALTAYAFAASEENAAGHRIVTAPTAGSSGVMPAVVYILKNHRNISSDALYEGLMAAASVGFLAKHNASIAGADVGCQGEIGVASAMAASFLAYAKGYRFQVAENAAEIALEHHLGLTCDPVMGYVQIPCIERNAMGALKAYTAFLIASAEIPGNHKVDLDQVIRAMAETGRDMCRKYKETSLGGLALSVVQC
jgi:L-serine dehydratase